MVTIFLRSVPNYSFASFSQLLLLLSGSSHPRCNIQKCNDWIIFSGVTVEYFTNAPGTWNAFEKWHYWKFNCKLIVWQMVTLRFTGFYCLYALISVFGKFLKSEVFNWVTPLNHIPSWLNGCFLKYFGTVLMY